MKMPMSFSRGLREMLMSQYPQQGQTDGGMFTHQNAPQDGAGPMPMGGEYEFTPQTFIKNRLQQSGPGMAYKFLKGFMS